MQYKDLIEHLKMRVLHTPEIIEAFEKVDRINFVPDNLRSRAYEDEPFPIGQGQTISQPYTVAVMTEALMPCAGQKILEIGTGSGWQSAILSEIVGATGKIITIERLEELATKAKEKLKSYTNVHVIVGDGSDGYENEAPYDRIIVTASARSLPEPLIEQLKNRGRMVIPIGREMFAVDKDEKGNTAKTFLGYFVFVPLVCK